MHDNSAQRGGASGLRDRQPGTENTIQDAARAQTRRAVPENKETPAGRGTGMNHPSVRVARRALKKLTAEMYQELNSRLQDSTAAKMAFIGLFAAAVFCDLSDGKSREADIYAAVAPELSIQADGACGQGRADYAGISDRMPALRQYLLHYRAYVDDILSWAYQYVNKLSLDSGLENTQFFTETYMIAYLTSELGEDWLRGGRYLDPACGGGNFLSYLLERLYRMASPSPERAEPCLQALLTALYGYELDPNLAAVASVNLKLKALTLLAETRPVRLCDWMLFCPNVFTSVERNREGFLSADFQSHRVRRAADGAEDTLAGLVQNVVAIYTNPPFQTIKGMDGELKAHLKKHFPAAKCDLCNAFLLQCIHKTGSGGTIGLVTQSSWMYLDSFAALREQVVGRNAIHALADLGSGAFHDLSGEKANVALVRLEKGGDPRGRVQVLALRELPRKEKILALEKPAALQRWVEQEKLFGGGCSAFSLRQEGGGELPAGFRKYGEYGVPMQGTSTGDAAKLIAYYWEHLGDREWIPVSKGGGYSRWRGLNSYVLKWGVDGEYIRDTKGSALRNTRYFDRTALVYSDTGTAGFNARLLEKGQVFVASGPGIRDVAGSSYAHLALLNSRLFSYYLRRLSPKLTVAAGYISRVPVPEGLLELPELESLGRECCRRKVRFLAGRPSNLEWTPPSIPDSTVEAYAARLFLDEMEGELEKLACEARLDDVILQAYKLTRRELDELEEAVGRPAGKLTGTRLPADLDEEMARGLDAGCQLARTRANRRCLGCDGLLEWIAQREAADPAEVVALIRREPEAFPQCRAKYTELALHGAVLAALGFRTDRAVLELSALRQRFFNLFPALKGEWDMVEDWILHRFSAVHAQSFYSHPYYRFEGGAFQINYEG